MEKKHFYNHFEVLFKNQDIPLDNESKDFHVLGLQYQIYSPIRVRMLQDKGIPWYIKEDTPKEILELSKKASALSDDEIDFELNKYYMHKAIRVMSAYKNGSIPLTNLPHVETAPQNLLSKEGEKALSYLITAAKEKDYTLRNREIALLGSHKFLLKSYFYRDFDIDAKKIMYSVKFLDGENKGKTHHIFPTIQITRGCYNECSHCMANATAKNINHMPYPMFVKIYEALLPHYKNMPMYTGDTSFGKHFDDSDPLHYQDNIMGVDYGDIVTLLSRKYNMPAILLTRGVRGKKSKIAFAKVLDQGIAHFPISFVDTPKENIEYNLKQLKDTLQIVNSMPVSEEERSLMKEMIHVTHLHLNSGPSVTKETLNSLAFDLSDKLDYAKIYAVGRARQFDKDELFYPWEGLDYNPFTAPVVITPRGNTIIGKVNKKGEYNYTLLGNIFDKKFPLKNKKKNILKRAFEAITQRQHS